MTTSIVYTAKARLALLDIAGFIALDDDKAAFRMVAELQSRLHDTLSLFPEAGARDRQGQRVLTIRRYSAVYRFDAVANTVFVLDFYGAGQNWR